MEKLPYETPELKQLGDVAQLTQGEGIEGNDDQFWFFRWGEDPSSG